MKLRNRFGRSRHAGAVCAVCLLALLGGQRISAQETPTPAEVDTVEAIGEGTLTVGIGLAVTAGGLAIINNFGDFSDCDGRSDEPDPDTGKSPKEACEERRFDAWILGSVFTIGGLVVVGIGTVQLFSAVSDSAENDPGAVKPLVTLYPCPSCRLPGIRVGLQVRF